MMQAKRVEQVAVRPPLPPPGLAARHAEALYRPVPPVGCDDDGYPISDDKPVESIAHGQTRDYLASALRTRYRDRPDVCVAADLGVYFERGNRRALLVPDFMIAVDVDGRGNRHSFKVWDEGRVPDLALEILSPKTWRRDLRVKPDLYRDLGVREYWTVDVVGLVARSIVGRQLIDGDYAEIRAAPSGGYPSEVLGLELHRVAGKLRLRESVTGEFLPDHTELTERYQEATAKASREAAARRDAEARVAALEEELRRLKR